jgi:hypothetical protein
MLAVLTKRTYLPSVKPLLHKGCIGLFSFYFNDSYTFSSSFLLRAKELIPGVSAGWTVSVIY